jgi:multiple sugar transport system permease protein
MRLPGEKIILAAVLIVTLFPAVLLFLGLLEVVRMTNLGNNYLALILPYSAINLPLTILVMRSFFQQLPKIWKILQK